MQIACPHCQAGFEVDEEYIGQEAECPTCEKSFVIEAPAPAGAKHKIGLKKNQGPTATELAEAGAVPHAGGAKSLLDAAAHAGDADDDDDVMKQPVTGGSKFALKRPSGPTNAELAAQAANMEKPRTSVLEAAANAGAEELPKAPEDPDTRHPSNLHLKRNAGPTASELAERAALIETGQSSGGSVLDAAAKAGYTQPPKKPEGHSNLHLKEDSGPSTTELAAQAAMHSKVGAGAAGLENVDVPDAESAAEHTHASLPPTPSPVTDEPEPAAQPAAAPAPAAAEPEKKKKGCGLFVFALIGGGAALTAITQLMG